MGWVLWLVQHAAAHAAHLSRCLCLDYYEHGVDKRRDEVLAEWQYDGEGNPSLHVRCHVSGEERWLAPPALRNYIFKREMPLVRPFIRSRWMSFM